MILREGSNNAYIQLEYAAVLYAKLLGCDVVLGHALPTSCVDRKHCRSARDSLWSRLGIQKSIFRVFSLLAPEMTFSISCQLKTRVGFHKYSACSLHTAPENMKIRLLSIVLVCEPGLS